MARIRPIQQKRGPCRRGWSGAREAAFFAELSHSGSVLRASLAIEFESTSSAYKRYNKDWEFRSRWDAAVAEAEQRLDQLMLARAIEAAAEGGVEGDLAKAPVSFRDALAFINRKRKGQAPQPIRPLDPEAARAELLEMVLAIKRGREQIPSSKE